ncbi:ATP-binding protein [Streptomyces sp. NRRL S-340]|uniref:ATP-binding protein n=1 Tax=Streptomyces sp. NRRL S-340 TaxID=1463901 RepID=UPI001F30AAD7|nr:ATP-binding protein [Streptomyces sp. NRRL S-340]
MKGRSDWPVGSRRDGGADWEEPGAAGDVRTAGEARAAGDVRTAGEARAAARAGTAGEGGAAQEAEGARTTVTLSGEGACIAEARACAAAFFARDGAAGHRSPVPERFVGLVQLVVSELVTNACKYAHGPVVLRLCLSGGTVRVEVWDSAPVFPTAQAPDPHRVGRHGLEIVRAVASVLTVRSERGGKTVVAHIPLGPGEAADTPDTRPRPGTTTV